VASEQSRGFDCFPKFSSDDILLTANTYNLYCRKFTNNKNLLRDKIKFGYTSILPVQSIIDELNSKHGASITGIPQPNSAQTAISILNNDIDYGLIMPQVAKPLVENKQLECIYSTNPRLSNYIGNTINLAMADFSTPWVLLSKTDNNSVKDTMRNAVQSKDFIMWLNSAQAANIKTRSFTQKDVDIYINEVYRMRSALSRE
jgi:hypothetical protein